ncbi:unnamed protein product [Cylindrotheca closterium]|uniref:Uncharacterized protein n=1 Tax=Cylindrotheca closterium TaxID=2856 RepID=A0AAD2CJV7_9STRA|nr:unnamed protein product [Cylindrotheca closterium]
MCQPTILVPLSKGMTLLSLRKDDCRRGTQSQAQSHSGNAKWKKIGDTEEKKQIRCSVELLTLLRNDLVACILSDVKDKENEKKQQPKKKQSQTRPPTKKRRKLGHEESKGQ